MMNQQKKICIAFLGNAQHDSRITNLANSLKEDGYKVSIISFDWLNPAEKFSGNELKIFKLTRGKFNLFFYLRFALILIRELFKTKADLYFAEDLYTLPFVTVIAKLKRAKVYYNSRELYAFIGGLRNRPFLQAIVKQIEKFFITKVDLVLTTGEMDSAFIEKFYGIKKTLVIRNIPLLQIPSDKIDFRKLYNIPADKLILLYQGVLLEGRGVQIIMRAMVNLPNTVLVILGDGEQKNNFQKLSDELKISERIFYAGTINQKELINYTAGADVGLSLIENISISYYHALPNKLFEYIMARLPVLCSDLPQMKKIVEGFNVGESVSAENENNIYLILRRWSESPELLDSYRKNCLIAAQELNWQEEYKKSRKRLLDLD
ncbi:MAG: glycosyltransferase [Ignavibacteriales bacterium]|nr:glycosyltransferase [Ignavibacteriales bacterium]